jgi:transposase
VRTPDPHFNLAELIGSEARAKVARRRDAVRLALLGETAADVAEHVFLSERQVRTWVARNNGSGAYPTGGATG